MSRYPMTDPITIPPFTGRYEDENPHKHNIRGCVILAHPLMPKKTGVKLILRHSHSADGISVTTPTHTADRMA